MASKEMLDTLTLLLSKIQSEEELSRTLRLPPGCKLERKCEERTLPLSYYKQHRYCGRITGCDDPSDNSDWVCGDWLGGPC